MSHVWHASRKCDAEGGSRLVGALRLCNSHIVGYSTRVLRLGQICDRKGCSTDISVESDIPRSRLEDRGMLLAWVVDSTLEDVKIDLMY